MVRWVAVAVLSLGFWVAPADSSRADEWLRLAQAESDPLEDLYGEEADELDDSMDPLEIPNRLIFAVNGAVDFLVLRPVAATYNFWVPKPVRDSVGNFLRNISTPVILANDLLQGEFARAETTVTRFAINSTAGALGLFDIAEDKGYSRHTEDFGQTLGSYGVGEGLYLVLPLFGPSSARDGTGIVVDYFLDPINWFFPQSVTLGRAAADGVQFRSENYDLLDELQRDSIDFYARVRSLYRQNRVNEIRNGEPTNDLPGAAISRNSPLFEQWAGLY